METTIWWVLSKVLVKFFLLRSIQKRLRREENLRKEETTAIHFTQSSCASGFMMHQREFSGRLKFLLIGNLYSIQLDIFLEM
ncbi:hypothetical protein SUGI_0252860 [Cryptomeria japonica]|nr:hypothetical protein SUGI_0252860 [Cryptomeria japonica]